MPYIHTKCNIPVGDKERAELVRAFGAAISLLPGKDERYLMVDIEGGAHLALAGKSDRPLAMIEVELFGRSTDAAYGALTARLTEEMGRILSVPPDGIYVKYAEVGHWGYAGTNF